MNAKTLLPAAVLLLAAIGIAVSNSVDIAKFYGPATYYYYYVPPVEKAVVKPIEEAVKAGEEVSTITPPRAVVTGQVVQGATRFDVSEYVTQGVVTSDLVLRSPDRKVEMVVPSLTLLTRAVEQLTITVRSVDVTAVEVPEGYRPIEAYRIEASSEAGYVELVAPEAGITLRFRVALAEVRDPANLVVLHIKENRTRVLLPAITLEGPYVVVTVKVPSLSTFVIAEKQGEAVAKKAVGEETAKPSTEKTKPTTTTTTTPTTEEAEQPAKQPAEQAKPTAEEQGGTTVTEKPAASSEEKPKTTTATETTEASRTAQPTRPTQRVGAPNYLLLALAAVLAIAIVVAAVVATRRRRA